MSLLGYLFSTRNPQQIKCGHGYAHNDANGQQFRIVVKTTH